MNVLIVGLNHQSAPVVVREKLAFEGERLIEGLKGLCELPGVNEAVIVSTCNRVEIYVNTVNTDQAAEEIKRFVSEYHDIEPHLLDGALYFHTGPEAVRHSFRVACSLDSMVVGEPQILGQLKDAFEASLRSKATGVLLNKLMKKSISVAKRVRTETRIAENAVSISFAAVELAKKIFSDLSEKSVMLLGAGEMAELAAKHLVNNGVREIVLSNRTFKRAEELAREMDGHAVRFEDFPKQMHNSDILICSTGAQDYVVTKAQMHDVMRARKQEPVFMIDLSVPRNIDPAINDMPNVYLYNIDDLADVVDTNKQGRKMEAEKAEAIVAEEVETFLKWCSGLDAVPTIVALREMAESIRLEEIEKFIKRQPDMDQAGQQAVSQLVARIINKLIHPPTDALKKDAPDRDALIALTRRLYGLGGEDNED